MNILTDTLPEVVEIDGIQYPLNYDFKTCLRIILAWEDEELTGYEKQLITLGNLYKTQPENIKEAMELAEVFVNGGKESSEEGDGLRLYSFSKDANFIYAAFKQTHGIDLQKDNLHWYEFLALFMDLGSETTFCQLIALRKKVKTGQATKEEKQTAREMGDLFEIPDLDTRTPEEKKQEAEFDAALARGK